MKVSIITVVLNAKSEIEKTIQSVLNQDYKNIEYIIVDGSSTDGTKEIAQKYASENSNIILLSEKDSGLYDAMNKGLKLSNGELIEFLNAGDEFVNNSVVSRIVKRYEIESSIDEVKADSDNDRMIIYGNIIYKNTDGTENVRLYGKTCGKPIYYATGDCVNHQAIFASKSCFRKNGNDFDDKSLRICADRDWMMRQSQKGTKWVAIGELVVKYQLDKRSISVKDKKRLRLEERVCMKRHYPQLYPIYLIFDLMRHGKLSSKLLHGVYKMLYIRK